MYLFSSMLAFDWVRGAENCSNYQNVRLLGTLRAFFKTFSLNTISGSTKSWRHYENLSSWMYLFAKHMGLMSGSEGPTIAQNDLLYDFWEL